MNMYLFTILFLEAFYRHLSFKKFSTKMIKKNLVMIASAICKTKNAFKKNVHEVIPSKKKTFLILYIYMVDDIRGYFVH